MSLRLFVAIAFPAEIKARLAALCGGLVEVEWVREANLHLSLRFIGLVDEALADDIVAALGSIRAPALDHLAGKIKSALVRCSLAPETCKFTPHVTLARFNRPPAQDRLGTWIAAHNLFRAGPIAVNGFTLFSSVLGAGGADYRPEAEFPLDGGWHDGEFGE